MNNPNFDKNWTLFLDRDGVINNEHLGSYIMNVEEFTFCDGSLEAMKRFNDLFGNIVVVTNQRGVGKGLMTLEDLKTINNNMMNEVADAGGRIDMVYAATSVNNNDHNRKPNPGMALQAKEDFPTIDFKKSVMVGNAISDMEFGKKLAMHTIFITSKHEPFSLPHDLINEQFPTLNAWSETLIAAEMTN